MFEHWVPLCVVGLPVVLFLVLGSIYEEGLRQAGLWSVFRKGFPAIPFVTLAAYLLVVAYREAREAESLDGVQASRSTAAKYTLLVALPFVVLPVLPTIVVLLHWGPGQLTFGAVALFSALTVVVHLVWPLFLRSICERDAAVEGELRARILHLAEASGVRVRDLIVSKVLDDSDEDDDSPNAYLTGLGRSRLVVIEGELAALLEPPELDAIVAHEFAHASEHHIAKKIAVLSVLALGFVAVGALSSDSFGGTLWLFSAYALCVLIKFAVDRRFEFAADRKAAEWAGALHMRNALAKLGAASSKSSRTPSWLQTHPSIAKRIARMEAMSDL